MEHPVVCVPTGSLFPRRSSKTSAFMEPLSHSMKSLLVDPDPHNGLFEPGKPNSNRHGLYRNYRGFDHCSNSFGSGQFKGDGHPNTCSRQILLHGVYNNQCKVKTDKSMYSMAGG